MFFNLAKFLLCSLWLLAGILGGLPARGAGVTIITHGFDGDVTGWIAAMANVIPGYYHRVHPGVQTNFTEYTMTVTYNGSSYLCAVTTNGSPPTATASGEIVVRLDWSQMAGITSQYDLSTSNVAWAVSQMLLQTNLFKSMNGHALVELPIHLIGHSRGGSLMSELCRQLGTNGLWIDHETSLDPHPLNNDGNNDSPIAVVDAPVHTYENVLFHDDYWQHLGNGSLDPDGEAVAGAYMRQLTSLTGGYSNGSGINDPYQYHSNVHLWYHGSIVSNTPTSYSDDGTTETITTSMRTSWWVTYEDKGTNTGFAYSLIGGGNRMSEDHPLGLPADPAIVDGYNQNWDLGAGVNPNRTALPRNNGTWPNVIKFDVTGTNTLAAGGVIGSRLYYQYAGTSNLTLQIFADSDFNPYNSNSISIMTLLPPASGADSVAMYANLGLATTNLAPGSYALYAKISDGVHTRYLYAPEQVQIVTSNAPPVLDLRALSASQWVVGIQGAIGERIVLQQSGDLQNWLPLATNTLTANYWMYTNNPGASVQFYRAVVTP